jgi:hypothetical protein
MEYQLFVDEQKTLNKIKRAILYNIPTEFGISRKSVRLLKIYLTRGIVAQH